MAQNLEAQLDELELLQSMFSSPGEFEIEDKCSYDQASAYLKHITPDAPKTLSCALHISIDAHHDDSDNEDGGYTDGDRNAVSSSTASSARYNIDIGVRLSNSYPDTYPDVFLSSNELKRRSQDELNSDLRVFLSSSVTLGDVCLLTVVEWVRDNAGSYFPIPSNPDCKTEQESDALQDGTQKSHFCRMWLYMHHIYSKTKRRNILAQADELELTGFCLPGKPGVVCVEGTNQTTKEFYNVLRRWNWKSIACRKRENVPSGDIANQRRLKGFQELCFDMHGHRQNHMDMGQFLDYLKEHSLEYMFKELFGVEGHTVSK